MSNEFLKNLRNLSAFRVNAFPGETRFSDRFGRIRASRFCQFDFSQYNLSLLLKPQEVDSFDCLKSDFPTSRHRKHRPASSCQPFFADRLMRFSSIP